MTVTQYLTALAANTQATLNLVRPYSLAALTFRAAGECSIADLLEHIYLVDGRTLQLLGRASTQIAPMREIYGNETLRRILLDFTEKPRLTPSETTELRERATTYADFEQRFVAQRRQLCAQLADGQLVISNQAHKHAYLGEMTIMDWLYYLLHHTSRHLHDIAEVARLLPPSLSQRQLWPAAQP